MRPVVLGAIPAVLLIGGLAVGPGLVSAIRPAFVEVTSSASVLPMLLLGFVVAAQVAWAVVVLRR